MEPRPSPRACRYQRIGPLVNCSRQRAMERGLAREHMHKPYLNTIPFVLLAVARPYGPWPRALCCGGTARPPRTCGACCSTPRALTHSNTRRRGAPSPLYTNQVTVNLLQLGHARSTVNCNRREGWAAPRGRRGAGTSEVRCRLPLPPVQVVLNTLGSGQLGPSFRLHTGDVKVEKGATEGPDTGRHTSSPSSSRPVGCEPFRPYGPRDPDSMCVIWTPKTLLWEKAHNRVPRRPRTRQHPEGEVGAGPRAHGPPQASPGQNTTGGKAGRCVSRQGCRLHSHVCAVPMLRAAALAAAGGACHQGATGQPAHRHLPNPASRSAPRHFFQPSVCQLDDFALCPALSLSSWSAIHRPGLSVRPSHTPS